MAINFPDSPTTNDTHTVGSTTWTYDGTKWKTNAASFPVSVTSVNSQTGVVSLDYDDLVDKTITVCDETVFNLTGTALDATNGPIQYATLTANTTFTSSMLEGQSMTLMLDDGTSAYTATWPTMTWVGGSAPTLPTSGYAVIVLWVVNGTLYGNHTGDA